MHREELHYGHAVIVLYDLKTSRIWQNRRYVESRSLIPNTLPTARPRVRHYSQPAFGTACLRALSSVRTSARHFSMPRRETSMLRLSRFLSVSTVRVTGC